MKKNGNTGKLQLMAKELKKICKRKISITESFLVIFLITGGIAYSEPLTSPKENIVSEKQISEKLLAKKISISGTNTITGEIITLKYTSTIAESIESKNSFKSMNDSIMNEMANSKINKIDELMNLEIDKRNTVDDLIKNFNIEYNDNLKLVDVNRKELPIFGAIDVGKIALAAGSIIYAAKEGFLSPEGAFHHSSKDSDDSSITPTPEPVIPPEPIIPPEPVIPPESIIVKNEIKHDIAGVDEIYEFSKVYDVRENGVALSAGGENSKVINNGELGINNDTGIGLQAIGNNSTAENIKDIKVKKGSGMYSNIATGNLTNKDSGLITIEDGKGMFTENGATGTNKSTITGTGAGTGVALYASKGGKVINDASGTINGNFESSIVATGKNSVGINKGTIKSSGKYGMFASDGAIITNEDGAQILNSGIYGMGAKGANSEAINHSKLESSMKATEGGKVINNKEIVTKHTYSMEADGKDSTAINNSKLSLTKGMFASNGGQILNEAKSTIYFSGENGMTAQDKDSTALNKGKISNTGNFGMIAENNAVVINEGEISNDGNKAMVAKGTNSIATNNGTISNKGTLGMYAEGMGSIATNNGTVSNNSNYGMLAYDKGTVINNANKNITNTILYSGMASDGNGSSAINYGNISNSGSYGMEASNSATATNEVSGVISNKSNYGMIAGSVGSNVINKGTISNKGEYGMVAFAGGKALNTDGAIIINNGIYGMGAKGVNSEAINQSKLERSMKSINGGKVINNKEIVTKHTYSMEADGKDSMAINDSTIVLTKGMLASGEGKIVNTKISSIVSPGEKAMLADGRGSIAVNEGNISNSKEYGMFAQNGGEVINEIDGIITTKGAFEMGATGKNSIARNRGTLYKEMQVLDNATIINEGKLNHTGGYAMQVKGGCTAINNSPFDLTKGMFAFIGGKIINTKISSIVSPGEKAMLVDGRDSIAINEGRISNNAEYGMFAQNSGEAINEVDGIITNKGTFAMGATGKNSIARNRGTLSKEMQAKSGATIINEGKLDHTGTYAMQVNDRGSTAINNSLVDLTKGMFASGGGAIINTKISSITSPNEKAMLADGVGSTATNEGKISNNGEYGMFAQYGGEVTNGVDGIITNKGLIGMGAIGKNSIARNRGTLSNQMRARDGATIINEGKLDYREDYIMDASNKGSTAINNSTFDLTKGMFASLGGKIINTKISSITSPFGKAMLADGLGSIAINEGKISNNGEYGIFAQNQAEVINEVDGIITNKGTFAMGATGKNSIARNRGTLSKEMQAKSGATIINEGKLDHTGTYAMQVNDKGSTAINDSLIDLTKGMFASGGGTIINETKSNISFSGDKGMYSDDSSLVNQGVISNKGNYGIYVTGKNGTAVNNGTVSNDGETKVAAFNGAIVTNEKTGIIIVSNNSGVGMEANGAGSRAVNKGTIKLTGNNQVAMYAKNNGMVTNDVDGIIDLSNATNGSSVKADTGGTIVNNGTVLLKNTPVKSDTTPKRAKRSIEMPDSESLLSKMMETPSFDTTDSVAQNSVNSSPKDSATANSPISLGNGGSFVNNGKFLVEGDFDSKDMGKDGKFILGGGIVEADSVRGDYYASGALALGSPEVSRTDGKVIQSTEYSNEYNTYQMFKANNMYANINSNSAMFDSKLTDKDTSGYYGIKMYRKNFSDVIDNDNFAKYLENNYKDEGKTDERTDLYKSYKLISTNESLNKVVKMTFGETIYPTLMEQNYKIAKLNNKSIKNEVFNKSVDQEVGDFNYIGYATYLNTENRKSDNFSENDMKYSSLSLGIDRKVSDTTRVGILGTVGKTDISFRDSASRKGDTYQVNVFGIYEDKEMKGTANLYTGKIEGDLSRKLSAPSISEEMKADTESNYYGLNLSLEKKYEFNAFTLSPRVELNSMQMSEEKVKEKGKYGLDLDETSGKSIESGLGFIAKKDILLSNSYKLTPELSAMYYRELGNPYKDRDVKLKSVSNDNVKIGKYDEGKDTGELNLGVALEKGGLGLKVGVNYEVNDQDSYITPYVNVGYIF